MKILISLSSSSLIDATHRFERRRLRDRTGKADNLSKLQSDYEALVRGEMRDARAHVVQSLHVLRLEAAPLYKEYNSKAFLPDVVSERLDDPAYKQQAYQFVQHNYRLLLTTLRLWVRDLTRLWFKYSALDWPVGSDWAKHTGLTNEMQQAKRLIAEFEDLK